MARISDALTADAAAEEIRAEASLRPGSFRDYVGQTAVVEKVKVYVRAASERKEALDHCLFSGPPGLGKTSLAYIIAAELGVGLHVTSGPALHRKGDLPGLLTNLHPRAVFFVYELDRRNAPFKRYIH